MMNKHEIDELMKDFDVKPVTKGLGFHHSIGDKNEVKSDLAEQKKALLDDLENRSLKLKNEKTPKTREDNFNMGELSAFYQKEEVREIKDLPDLIAKDERIETYDASLSIRFFAWLVDNMIIVTMLLATIMTIIVLSDMPLEILNFYMITDDLRLSFISIYLLYYIFYFSILDKTNYSTLGKRLFNIKVIGTYGSLSLMTSAARAILSLFSILTLGLFSLLSLQDSFTGTKVIRE